MILEKDHFVRIECDCPFCKTKNLYGRIAKLVKVLPESDEALVCVDDYEYWYNTNCLVTIDHNIELV